MHHPLRATSADLRATSEETDLVHVGVGTARKMVWPCGRGPDHDAEVIVDAAKVIMVRLADNREAC